MLTVPGKWLAHVLQYESVQLLVADCRYYNIEVDRHSNDIKFNKFDFDRTKDVVSSVHIVKMFEVTEFFF